MHQIHQHAFAGYRGFPASERTGRQLELTLRHWIGHKSWTGRGQFSPQVNRSLWELN